MALLTTRRLRNGVFSPAGRVLTASGVKVERQNASDFRRLIQPWQARALAYYDLVGECWFASQFYSRSLSQIRLFVATRDEHGEIEEIEGSNEATALLDRIRDPGGTGRSHLQAAYGRLMFITGEGYLTVTQPEGEEERWEFLSSDELRISSDNRYLRYAAPSLMATELIGGEDDQYTPLEGNGATVYRLWRRHPRYSAWADSPMRAVLDLFEELLLLQLAVLARVRSRLSAAGLLFVPEEITLPSQDTQTADEDLLEDPLLNALIEAAQAAIQDPGTASAVIPVLVRAQGEWIEKVRHIQFFNPDQAYPETGLRMEVIKRIALGLDLPPEILLGLADANHWTSWQIDEQTAKAHIFPVCQQFVDDLTAAYLRPAAREAGIQGWENLIIGYDAAALLVAPDRARDAQMLFTQGELSGDTLREAAGFNDEDAPTDDERARFVGLTVGDATLALTGVLGDQPTLPSDGVPEPAATPEKGPPPDGMPAESPAAANGRVGSGGQDDRLARVLGAAEFAVTRARALAGARLRSAANRRNDEQALILIDGIPNALVATHLGIEKVRELGQLSDQALVRGVAEELALTLVSWQLPASWAEKIGMQVERHAAQTLYREEDLGLPEGFAALLDRIEVTN